MNFYRKEELSHFYLLLLYWDKISELFAGFYNCFYLSAAKAANSLSLRKGLTTVFNKEMQPFIPIRDGRLAIDLGSYGNLSDQLNFRLHGLSRLSPDLIIRNALN